MATPWSSKGSKASLVAADEFMILDSADAVLATKNKRILASIATPVSRDGTGFIKPLTAGDNLNMLQGTIYTVDPSNTSGTKSYELSQTLTGVIPGTEHANTVLNGLGSGAQKPIFTYFGASNATTFGAENWTFDNTIGTIGQVLWKANLNTEGGTGIVLDQVYGKNSNSNERQYTQIGHIIETNTESSEDASISFSVLEVAVLTQYFKLDGKTKSINAYQPFLLASKTTVQLAAVTKVNGMIAFDSNKGYAQTVHISPITALEEWSSIITADGAVAFDSAIGVAPFAVVSTTKVANLNADLLDGVEEAAFLLADGTRALTGAWNAGAFSVTVQEDIISSISGTDGYQNATDASDVEQVRWDSNGDSWNDGGDTGFGNKAPLSKVDVTGDFRASLPSALFAFNTASYTTGTGLTTPASVAAPLTENLDANSVWTIDSPAAGEMSYSGITRYFGIQCNCSVSTNSGGASTITLKIQKQIGAGGWVDVPQGIVKRYLSGTNDTGSLCLGCPVSMSSGDDLRLEITSSAGGPKYDFDHIGFQISTLV